MVVVAMAEQGKTVASVRLATRKDVPIIVALIRELADFEELTHACEVTDAKLQATLWNLPPFQGPSVFMLEVGPLNSSAGKVDQDSHEKVNFEQVVREVALKSPLEDPACASFKSTKDDSRTIAGFVLFFPNYSTFLAKSGFYIEDLYVRKPYRGRGFGTILLKAVAQQAVKVGAGRVEWCVLDWNVNAIKFYEGIGATVMPEWRICRLTGKALESCSI